MSGPGQGRSVFLRERNVIAGEEFIAVRELLEDLEDLRELRAAKEQEGGPVVTVEEAEKALGLR